MILDEILAHKQKAIESLKLQPELREPPAGPFPTRRGFGAALRSGGDIRLIAEIKRRSPSKGDLCPHLDPAHFAGLYQDAGAAAISVLTDEHYFGGSLMDLRRARTASSVPVLRKDFIIDEVQIWQSLGEGGPDAILLIAAALSQRRLKALLDEAARCQVEALVETHNEEEIEAALAAGAEVIGVNNRDLQTFQVTLATTERLRALVPREKIMISESGIHTRADILRLQELGVDAVLIGEALVKSPNPTLKISQLLGK